MNFQVTAEAIDRASIMNVLQDDACGACVVFDGWIRNHNEGRKVLRLEYEVYRPLAISVGTSILEEAVIRFGIVNAIGVHREGLHEISEPAVIVGVSSHHRDAAFQACRYIIDEVKQRLPIWKKEYYEDGSAEWVNCRHCSAAAHSTG
jgi:molybdopterin synthase catalytic subunit